MKTIATISWALFGIKSYTEIFYMYCGYLNTAYSINLTVGYVSRAAETRSSPPRSVNSIASHQDYYNSLSIGLLAFTLASPLPFSEWHSE